MELMALCMKNIKVIMVEQKKRNVLEYSVIAIFLVCHYGLAIYMKEYLKEK
jgi:hypothetical protein